MIRWAAILLCVFNTFTSGIAAPRITPEQAIASKLDLWGEAALALPTGPTYEYFAQLLPPLRYVDARFHHYPIVLSAPSATTKGRLVSNGSQINALADQPNWVNEMGVPVHVLIGNRRQEFGADLRYLDGPKFSRGYLPIVQMGYDLRGTTYTEEVFASVLTDAASSGSLLGKFTMPGAADCRLELQFEAGYEFMTAQDGMLRDSAGKLLANFDENWEFNGFRSALSLKRGNAREGTLAIYTVPLDLATTPPRMSAHIYEQQRRACAEEWDALLARGMQVEVPESYVNFAWKSLLVGMFEIISGDKLNYSAANQYARMYASETGDAMRGLLAWGYMDDIRKLMPAMMRKRRSQMEFHYAGFELQSLTQYFFQTRDLQLVEQLRPEWEEILSLILSGREPESGMLPREKYCTDIDTLVYNLKSNVACWRGVRDMAVLLQDIGETSRSQQVAAFAADYRKTILGAIDRATSSVIDPPFLPIALGGEEAIHDPITDTRIGSYWNLVIGYVLEMGVFPYDSKMAGDILRYEQTHGGICMGMIRNLAEPTWWVHPKCIDDLYGIRYATMLQKRDEADRALVSFYGKLAQGMTRDTFIDGESTCLTPYDEYGRQLALPPNSTANSSFLQQLRGLLVQDWDLDDDGRAETLRLLCATPRAWLAEGKTITVQKAPTCFGPVSIQARSNISAGKVALDLQLPAQLPKSCLLKLRLPAEHELSSAKCNGRLMKVSGEIIDLTGLSGAVHLDVITTQGERK